MDVGRHTLGHAQIRADSQHELHLLDVIFEVDQLLAIPFLFALFFFRLVFLIGGVPVDLDVVAVRPALLLFEQVQRGALADKVPGDAGDDGGRDHIGGGRWRDAIEGHRSSHFLVVEVGGGDGIWFWFCGLDLPSGDYTFYAGIQSSVDSM